ncbi:MAG: peptidoglycan bridge formation glycyltransferase FemA/FemB family protein [Chloroflexi bacterium]|nr:peptidoglycan bridge formation glycyltransferase FemA/FemB family protein [Chloroflexota bacterium]
MRVRSTSEINEGDWNSFVAASPGGHILQSSQWGHLKGKFGWRAARVVIEDQGQWLAGAQVLFRPLGLHTLAYVPKGPITDLADEEVTPTLLEALHLLCRQRRAIFLKIEPDLAEDPAPVQKLTELGFRPSPQTIQPRRTTLLDLTPDHEAILDSMKSKTRYNIRLAARKGVTVRQGTAKDLPGFYRLMQLTGRRDRFGIHSEPYYQAAHQLFVPQGLAKLFLAIYEDKVLAGIMVFAMGRRAWYMYGASSDEHRNLMPNYLLQWEAIKWAKERGCLIYDLWGIPDEEEEVLEREFLKRNDGLWGVYRFKRGFGGQVVHYLGAYDYVYSPSLYWLYDKFSRSQ